MPELYPMLHGRVLWPHAGDEAAYVLPVALMTAQSLAVIGPWFEGFSFTGDTKSASETFPRITDRKATI